LRILLDTDVAIDLVEGMAYTLELFDHVIAGEVLLSIISYAEMKEGVLGAATGYAKNRSSRIFFHSSSFAM
jgi:predicted nucleic acid-binding protein